MPYCEKCGRNICLGYNKKEFLNLSPKQRAASLKAVKRWLKTFEKEHNDLISQQR